MILSPLIDARCLTNRPKQNQIALLEPIFAVARTLFKPWIYIHTFAVATHPPSTSSTTFLIALSFGTLSRPKIKIGRH